MLFSNKRKHEIILPAKIKESKSPNVRFLVNYLCENLMKDPRRELFVLDDSV